ncbi:MAG: methyltransferase domain-containing protein [Saprospiraceae bacterium]
MSQNETNKKNPPTRIHAVLIGYLSTALKEVFEEGKYADRVLEKTFRSNRVLGARDRAFIATTFYDIVRFYRRLAYAAGEDHDWLRIISIYLLTNGSTREPWMSTSENDWPEIQQRLDEAERQRSLHESVPDELDHYCEEQLGSRWATELHSLNERPPVILRTNTLKLSRDKLIQRLRESGIECTAVEGSSSAIEVHSTKSLFTTDFFKSGFFEMQDSASQRVAEMVAPQPGMKVIDACAGAGGKSLHLACLMQNKGRIIALDTEEWKLAELKKRARRNDIHIIETRVIDSSKVIKRLEGYADRVLLDVPCSGIGVWRRNPDAKYKMDPERIARIMDQQREILQQYSRMVKPGGQLIYATCSILPGENQQQIDAFLAEHPEFKLDQCINLWPSEHGTDGFFIARMSRVVSRES